MSPRTTFPGDSSLHAPGYRNRDISGGTLVIAVTEGKVEAVTLEGHEENAIRMAFPRAEGRVLNLRDAEQRPQPPFRLAEMLISIPLI